MRDASSLSLNIPCLTVLLLALTLSTAFAASPSEAPGTRIQVDPAALPAPDTSEAVGNFSEVVATSDRPAFQLPPGFTVNLFAKGFDRARWLTIAPDGAVLLSEGREPRVLKTKEVGIELHPGDCLEICSSGGGGWGPPAKRTPLARQHDREPRSRRFRPHRETPRTRNWCAPLPTRRSSRSRTPGC